MLRSFQHMFAPVAEFTEAYVSQNRLTAHPTLQTQWLHELDEANADLQKDTEMTSEEFDTFEKIQGLYIHGAKRFLERAKSMAWKDVNKAEKIAQILSRPQIPQRTPEWYLQGQRILTASEFSSLFSSERQYANLVLSKALPPQIREGSSRTACPTSEMSPFDWGIRFEPVVKTVFETRWGVKITDCGRIVHAVDTKLAASPDGLITEGDTRLGRLIEIKCPITRPIGTGTIPFDYWCQMQIQMEVGDIDECEYLEVKIDSRQRQQQGVRPETFLVEGTIRLLAKDGDYKYAYGEEEFEGYETVEQIPWYITAYHNEVVQRDRAWFAETASVREQFWSDVEAARAGTFKIPAPFRSKSGQACQIQDSPP